MLQSEYDVIVRHNRLKVLLIILTSIVVAIGLYAAIKVGREYLYKPTETVTGVSSKDADTPPKSFPEPTKTEFVDRFPADFPADIPVEKNFKFTQSYILDYPGQRQLSIIFPSMKTVKENFSVYTDYVKKEGWTVVSKEEKANFSFLYATKESMEMNVTISESTLTTTEDTPPDTETNTNEKPLPPVKSQVSVSVLRK